MKKVIMSVAAALILAGASVYATNSINHKTDNTNAKTNCCCPACPGCDDCACCCCKK